MGPLLQLTVLRPIPVILQAGLLLLSQSSRPTVAAGAVQQKYGRPWLEPIPVEEESTGNRQQQEGACLSLMLVDLSRMNFRPSVGQIVIQIW